MPLNRIDTWQIVAALGVASLYILYRKDYNQRLRREAFQITKSPLTTVLPTLSEAQRQRLAYPPDILPGARDVLTAYGSTRVYEIGPVDGQKVLLVHGISTPCVSLVSLARHLEQKGCRVILYDLYGRGYSDNPTNHPQSEHLYSSQILAVLASSPISWGADTGFHVIGYSLGGGIAAAFTRYFPHLVTSLVLIAPSGLLRQKHIAWQSHFLYHTRGLLPEWLTQRLVYRRLNNTKAQSDNNDKEIRPEDAMKAELGTDSNDHALNIKMDSAVQWQLDNHAGFLEGLMSSIRYAPISDQHEMFQAIGRDISNPESRMVQRKVLLLLGRTDSVILAEEIDPDIRATIGDHGVHTVVMEAGHDIVWSKAKEIVEEVWQFWTAG